MLLGYGAKVCLRKMRVKAENRMVTCNALFGTLFPPNDFYFITAIPLTPLHPLYIDFLSDISQYWLIFQKLMFSLKT